uniref:Uncharacterized protein n=1 Tax=Clastoptera arizonana TaxID=38151 RepID=A0A1B6C655_9HEMI
MVWLRYIIFLMLLMSGYMALSATSAAATYNIFDTERQWSPSQGDEEEVDSSWEQIPWVRQTRGSELYNDLSADKRALSMLSRWKSFNRAFNTDSGRPGRSSSLMTALMPQVDFVSAETRGLSRPVGQPLRWGRRR